MSSFEELCRGLLKDHGQLIRQANHGDLWAVGETTVMAQTHKPVGNGSHDPRAWKNTLAEIKRALRGPSQEGVIVSQQVESARPTRPTLSELGVHVERRSKVIREECVEVTISDISIGRLLGVVGDNGDVPTEVELRDVNGVPVKGPVLLVVKTIVETDS